MIFSEDVAIAQCICKVPVAVIRGIFSVTVRSRVFSILITSVIMIETIIVIQVAAK